VADKEKSTADNELLDGECYGRTALDVRLHEEFVAEIAEVGLMVCPDCNGWTYCGRCNDNGYLTADGQELPWGALARGEIPAPVSIAQIDSQPFRQEHGLAATSR
jgi:hypothetical protein